MRIEELKQAVLLCREASAPTRSITPLIFSNHGIGKSSAIFQLCQDNRLGFIDFRVSQIEATDLRGLPDRIKDKHGMRTGFLPPTDLPMSHPKPKTDEEKANPDFSCPACNDETDVTEYNSRFQNWRMAQAHYCKGELFLDEVPRGSDDVLQSLFQLILDRCVGSYVLPEGWHICSAGNFMEGGGYSQNNFSDKAWLDRFCHITLSITDEYLKDWTEYMTDDQDEIGTKIAQFVTFNPDRLAETTKSDLGFNITPSPRSWDMVKQVLKKAKNYPNRIVEIVLSGLVGMELTKEFMSFNMSITPTDIISKTLKTNEPKLKDLNRNQVLSLVWGVGATVKKVKTTEEIISNVLDFMEWLASSKSMKDARDLAVMLGKDIMSTDVKGFGSAIMSNPDFRKFALTRLQKDNKNKNWVASLNARESLAKLMTNVSYGL
jgi:hypothetical protein